MAIIRNGIATEELYYEIDSFKVPSVVINAEEPIVGVPEGIGVLRERILAAGVDGLSEPPVYRPFAVTAFVATLAGGTPLGI